MEAKFFFLFAILLAADPFNLLSCGVFPRILTIDFPSITLGFGFCLGVLFRCYADSISLNFRVCVSLLIAAWLFSSTSLSPYINILAFGYCIVCLSVERHVQELRPKLEISLGIFLYSFPIQQLFSYKFPGQGPYLNFICSIFTTMVVAIVSALWLEKWLDKLANEVYSKVLNICKI